MADTPEDAIGLFRTKLSKVIVRHKMIDIEDDDDEKKSEDKNTLNENDDLDESSTRKKQKT